MIIVKVLGCCGLLLLVALAFFYLREWYAKWRGEKELLIYQGKYEATQKEILRIRAEIDMVMSQYDELSPEAEWQGYCNQLAESAPKADSKQIGFFGLVWLMCNRQAREIKLCLRQCERVDELKVRLSAEGKLISRLAAIQKPNYIMSRINYHFWRQYLKERNKYLTTCEARS